MPLSVLWNPVFSCVSIAKKDIKQNLQNLLVIEENLKIELRGACNSIKRNLCGIHKAKGKIILKKGSVLNYNHIHSWGEKDIISTNYEFVLEKNSKLIV